MFTFKVDSVTDNKDGSATVVFSGVTTEVKDFVKNYYKEKRFSRKLFERFMLEAIENYLTKDI